MIAMARKSSAGPLIILGTIFLVFLVVLAAMPRTPLPLGGGWSILGNHLTTEVTPPETLYSTTINLQPGQVYQVTYNANGISVTPKSSQLIDSVNLSNVDLSANDVVAWHGYDWWLDGQDDFVYYGGFVTPNFTKLYVEAGYETESPGVAQKVFTAFSATPSIYWGLYNVIAWFEAWNSTSTGVTNGRITSYYQGFNNADNAYHRIGVYYDGSKMYGFSDGVQVSTYDPSTYGYDDGPIKYVNKIYVGVSGGTFSFFHGRIMYIVFEHTKPANPTVDTIISNPYFVLDPTIYNGTRYIDLVNGAIGIPHGGVTRLPADHPFLWLVKNLASDNMLHVRYVPPGSIFRIKYNGMIYEWHITGTPNNAGLIEDYPIDLASIFGQTVLPNATVQLIYPSQKVRFYVPSGFQVQITSSNWTETHQTPLNSSYVDFGLPNGGTYTIRVLGYEEQPRVTVQTTSSNVKVTVTDPNGYALSGAKVYIYNSNNELAAAGVTNDFGVFQFNKTALSGDQARIIVSHLSNGYYYHMDKLVTLNGLVTIQPRQPRPINIPEAAATGGSNSSAAVGIVIILLLAVLTVALLAGRRR